MITPAAACSSTPDVAPTEITRSTRLAEQATQPAGSYRDPARAGRTSSRKKTRRSVLRRKNQPLQNEEIISAFKNKSKVELESILQSLHLSVVPILTEAQINRGEQQQQQQPIQPKQQHQQPTQQGQTVESGEEGETAEKFTTATSSFMDDITGVPFGYSLPRTYQGPSEL